MKSWGIPHQGNRVKMATGGHNGRAALAYAERRWVGSSVKAPQRQLFHAGAVEKSCSIGTKTAFIPVEN